MAPFSFPYRLYGGATRPDAISGLTGDFRSALTSLYNAAPPEVQRELGLTSGYRSPEVQRQLYNASDRSGHMVAAPGRSRHNFGAAADLYGFGMKGQQVSPATRDWVRANAGNSGLYFPMHYEPRHIQYGKSWRGGDAPAPDAANMTSPSSAPGGTAALNAQPDANAPTITPGGTPPADPNAPPVDDQLTGANKQKPLAGLLGELGRSGGGDQMRSMELGRPSAGQQSTSLADMIQQYLTAHLRGQQPQQPGVITPPQGGPRLG